MREKRPSVVVFESVDVTQEQFDHPILWLLAALLIFMPAAFGSWDPWAEAVALAGACGLAILLAIKLIRRPDLPFVWSWSYLPIALFIAFVALQMTLLPADLVRAISPKTFATNHWLLGDLPNAVERLKHLRFSFYQEGGWHDLRNIAAVTCLFVVVINVFRRSEQMIQLMWVIAWVGTAMGLLAILQTVTGATAVYWYFPLWGEGRPDGGTFPNHNCFAQFMNLSTGPIVGLLLLKIDQTFRRHDYTPAEMFEKLTSSDFRAAWLLAAMLAITVASVFLSLSRGGMLSIAAAGIVVGILLAVRSGARGMGIGGWILGVIFVVVFSLVMAGGANLVEGRIARIGNPDDRYDRLQLSKDSLRAWHDYPAVGTGLGSFRFTFPPYDRSNVAAVASHAENEYVELLMETGVVGASIAGSFWLIILGNFLRARARGKKNRDGRGEGEEAAGGAPSVARSSETGEGERKPRGSHHRRSKSLASPASSLSLGLCFGLVAILVHSGADFGQHCISIASLTAISCALLVNLASLRRRERGLEVEGVRRGFRPLRSIALVLVAIVSGALVWQANEARAAMAAFQKADDLRVQLGGTGWKGDQGDFTDMNRAASEAERLRPNSMRYRFWGAMDGFSSISDVVDPATDDVVLNDEKLKILKGLTNDLQDAQWACPTFGPLYSQLGQWERDYLGKPADGARHIRMAFDLAPGDPVVCLILGEEEADEGAWADSVVHFRRAASLDASLWSEAADVYMRFDHHPESALALAGDDVDELHSISLRLRALGKDAAGPTTGPATLPSDEAVALEADKRASALVRQAADRPDASAKTLGELGLLCAKEGDAKDAATYLGRALKFEYGNVDWRLTYARSLAKIGKKADAIHQAEIVLLIRPHIAEAQDLIDQLTMKTKPSADE